MYDDGSTPSGDFSGYWDSIPLSSGHPLRGGFDEGTISLSATADSVDVATALYEAPVPATVERPTPGFHFPGGRFGHMLIF